MSPQTPKNHFTPEVDVLLVTVVEVETKAILNLCLQTRLFYIGDQTYYDLGIIGEARIFLVQSEMGAGGPGGAMLTIQEGIVSLAPSAVIMVGIAFGTDEKKQEIGDILVSKQIMNYDLQKIGTNNNNASLIIPRGDCSSASPRMLSRFRAASNYWTEPSKVRFGLILSGAKLVDNQDFRNQLLKLEPEAIGGEMEGEGLYAAAYRKKVDWILVKAICDWANGDKGRNKQAYQELAAANAARFVIKVLTQGGLQENASSTVSPKEEFIEREQTNIQTPTQSSSSTTVLLQSKIDAANFDVFLCYNSRDKAEVKKIGRELKSRGILPWLDEWNLIPGQPWQRALEEQIRNVKAAAVFVGPQGMGPWHRSEMDAFLRQVKRRSCPIIPILLPGNSSKPELPIFLEEMQWIDFRVKDPDPLDQLIQAIIYHEG